MLIFIYEQDFRYEPGEAVRKMSGGPWTATSRIFHSLPSLTFFFKLKGFFLLFNFKNILISLRTRRPVSPGGASWPWLNVRSKGHCSRHHFNLHHVIQPFFSSALVVLFDFETASNIEKYYCSLNGSWFIPFLRRLPEIDSQILKINEI